MFNRKDILFTLILGGIIVCFSWCAARTARTEEPPPTLSIPSQTDIQIFLDDAGYDIGPKGVDGKIGEDSRLAWDKYIMETRYVQDNRDGFE